MKSPGSRKRVTGRRQKGKMGDLERVRSRSFVQMPTRHRLARVCLFSLLFVTSAFAQAPEGIPRDLARLRAQQLKNVRYDLNYTIMPKADSISGPEELRFI